MRYVHGKKHSKIYNVWCGMMSRCMNPNNQAYKNYGGRGITVCDAWRCFPAFYADMGDPPAGLSLERVDNDRGYEPGNCCWATKTEQSRNRRNLHLLTIDGETQSMGAWAERCGIKVGTLWMRIKNGWSPEAAVKTPIVRDRNGMPRGYRWADPSASEGRLGGCGGLTSDQVAEVLAMPRAYGSGRELAKKFGVHEQTISKIRARYAQHGVDFGEDQRVAA